MQLIVVLKCHNAITVGKGYLARVSRSKISSKKEPYPQRRSNPCSATHVLTENSVDYSIYNVTGSPVQPLKVTVIVNNAT